MDIVQQRPGLLLKQLCFLGWKCPVFLQVQLWYLSINFLQILGTATAVLPFSPEHPLPPALPHLQLVSLRAPWAAAASPSVPSSVHAAKPQRTQEWKREKPVAQEGCSGRTRLCLAPGEVGVSPEWGAGAVRRVTSCQEASAGGWGRKSKGEVVVAAPVPTKNNKPLGSPVRAFAVGERLL